jgi:hypothetical protein
VLRHGQTLSIYMLFLCQPLKFHVPVSHVFCVLLLHRCGVNSSSEMINETNTAKGKTAAQREACATPSPLPIFMISYISSLGHALAQSLSVSAGQSKLCAFYGTGRFITCLQNFRAPVQSITARPVCVTLILVELLQLCQVRIQWRSCTLTELGF